MVARSQHLGCRKLMGLLRLRQQLLLLLILLVFSLYHVHAATVDGFGTCRDDSSVTTKRVSNKDDFKDFLACAQMRAPTEHVIEVAGDIELTGAYMPGDDPSGLVIMGLTKVRIVGVQTSVPGHRYAIKGQGEAGGYRVLMVDALSAASKVVLENLEISNGHGLRYGGGIMVTQGNLEMRNCTIQANSAAVTGGGLYLGTGVCDTNARQFGWAVNLFSCNITGNGAADAGGIYNSGTGTLVADPATRMYGNSPELRECATGEYIVSIAVNVPFCSECDPGKAGYGDEIGHFGCTKCGPGTYLPTAGATTLDSCLPCPPGTFQNASGSSLCFSCEPGFFNNKTGQTACDSKCPSGSYSPTSATECIKCMPGKFNQLSGQGSCVETCPPGEFSNEGAISCEKCPKGTHNPDHGRGSCLECTSGTISPTKGNSGAECSVCGPGTYTDGARSYECKNCPPGTFANTSKNDSPNDCQLCEQGKTSGFGASNCTKCATGSTTLFPGASYCSPCQAGQYIATNQRCERCPRGKMSLAAAQECSFCEQGFYAKADQTGCDACPAGHYGSPDENLRDKNTTGCLPCRAGSYSRALGIDTADKCVACPPGKHGTLAASISEAACKECDVGRYSNNTGLTSCSPCPPGTATDGTINLGRGQTRCSTCPAGTEVNVLKTLCVKCPSGMQSLATETCSYCERGWFAKADQTGCNACPAGRHGAPDKTLRGTNATCLPCPIGTYSGATGVSEEKGCVPCPVGRFGIISSATNRSQCSKCSAGSYASEAGMQSCTPCDAGFYCSVGASVQQECTAEYDCSDPATKIARPSKPKTSPTLAKSGGQSVASLDVTLPGEKQEPDAGLGFDLELQLARLGPDGQKIVVNATFATTAAEKKMISITNLHFNSRYFARLYNVSSNGTRSTPGDWSISESIPCPSLAYCGESRNGGVEASQVRAQDGCFRVSWAPNNLTFHNCSTFANCEGGRNGTEKCREGTHGPMCDLCVAGYTKAGGRLCERCMGRGWQIFYVICGIVVGTVALAVLIYSTIESQGMASDTRMGILKAALRYCQFVALAVSFPLKWPPQVEPLFDIMDVATSAASQVVSVECTVGTDFVSNAKLTFALPALIIVGILVFWLLRAFFTGKQLWGKWIFFRVEVSVLVALTTLHTSLTKVAFQFLHCGDEIVGRSLLRSDASITCWGSRHVEVIWSSFVPAAAFFVIGIPALLLWLLYSNRYRLETQDVKAKLGFLYSNYRPGMFYWEVIVIAKLVVFALISVVYEQDIALQVELGSALLFISVLLHVVFRPFASKTLYRVEATALVANWATLFCGTLLFNERVSVGVKTFITILLVVIQAGFFGICMLELWWHRDRSGDGQEGSSAGGDPPGSGKKVGRRIEGGETISTVNLASRAVSIKNVHLKTPSVHMSL